MMLGGLFYGGLWWTVPSVLHAKQPALWFLASRLLRTAVVLVGFYYIGQGHWERLIACLLGFILAQFIVTRLAGEKYAS